MSKFVWLIGLTLAASAGLGAHPAGATTINGTFTGTMNAGSVDTYGYFGTAETDYSGFAITGTFTYDTTALAPNSCTVVVGEGCYSGPITISETIAGAGTMTFHSTAPLVNGLVLYGGFPAASSATDEFTIASVDTVTGPSPGATENGTTISLDPLRK